MGKRRVDLDRGTSWFYEDLITRFGPRVVKAGSLHGNCPLDIIRGHRRRRSRWLETHENTRRRGARHCTRSRTGATERREEDDGKAGVKKGGEHTERREEVVRRVVSSGVHGVACVQPPLGTRRIPQCAVFIRFNFISPGAASSGCALITIK